jgi:hypothetical protein
MFSEHTPAAAPSDGDKLKRLHALQEATRCAALLQGVTGYDEATRKQKLATHMAVIRAAFRDALHEINRCSRATEGKQSADPWFDLLHWQALLAIAWVQQHAGPVAQRRVWIEATNGDHPSAKLNARWEHNA